MSPSQDTTARGRIVDAASQLLTTSGRDAVSSRAVSAAAGVQAPAIYRHFSDMDALLDEAASRSFASYLEAKRVRPREADPVDDLRRGWDLHVEFGLACPSAYSVLYGDPTPGSAPVAVEQGHEILRGILKRIADAGRLNIEVERARQIVHSACKGVTLTLIGLLPEERDPSLSDATREAILSVVTVPANPTEPSTPGHISVATRAIALKSALERTDTLTPAETALLSEWLDRLAAKRTR